MVKTMDRMGYGAAALGEMDLYLGLEKLKALDKMAGFRFLSANLFDRNGNTLFEPYVLFHAGELRVMVLGLTQPPTRPDLFENFMDGGFVRDPFETAGRLVPKIRSKCDLLVILSNLGYTKDLELAREVDGIDVIIGGKTRRFMYKPAIQNNTLITSGYFQGRAMGRLLISYTGPVQGWIPEEELRFLDRQIVAAQSSATTEDDRNRLHNLVTRRETAGLLTRYVSDMVNLGPTWSDNSEIVSMIRGYRRNLAGTEAPPQGITATEDNPSYFTGPQICVECHESRYRFWIRTPHAKAYDTLEVKGAGADPDCLPCHVTGFMQRTGYRRGSTRHDLRNVTCESCHGIGSLHSLSSDRYSLIHSPNAMQCMECHTKDRDSDFDYFRDKALVCNEE
jgi:hypothetical protein